MNQENIGKFIAELRKENNMTQKELAERIGVTESVISRYISGDREPKPNMIANIATALHTTSDYLLGLDEDYSYPKIFRIIARNSSKITKEERRQLLTALFGEEIIWNYHQKDTKRLKKK